MAGYTRQSTYTDGDIINAADSNDEFDQLVSAFANTTGHAHDGTAGEGPVIGLIGDPGAATPKNKIVVDDTNNQIEVSIDVSGTSTEQFIVKDGVIEPTTDDDIDLGSSTKKFKDAYVDGTAYLDAINFNGTAISATAAELNIMDGVTATTAELNIMDGVTATTAELNIMDGVTASTAELNIMDGVTATTAELNLMDGVTSTTAELNIVDGSTTATATTVAAADRVVLNDNGTMVQAAVTDLDTFFSGTTKTLTNKTLTSPVISTISNTGTITLPTSTDTLVGRATTDTLTNKTLTSPTITTATLNGNISGTSIKDEDTMVSDSANHLATQQSIKAYVDAQVAGKDALSELSGDSDDITEGTTNLFFTNERVDDRVNGLLTAGSNITLTYDDAGNSLTIASTDTGITDVVSDTSPQLGGDLDVNTNNISFGDSTTAGTDDTLKFGAGDDMLMYHDGTHGYIQVPTGSGNMRIATGVFNVRSANNNLNQISTLSSGSVSLYYNGAKKFDTASTGVDITGSLDVTDASTTRTNLGVAIGSDVQAYDAGLTSIAGLTTAANKVIYTTASDTYAVADFSAFGRSLVDDADATAARTTLGLGTAATQTVGTSANNVVQLDGSSRLPAVDGSQLTNLPASGDGGIAMAIALG